MTDTTITSVSLGRRPAPPPSARPHLVMIALADDLRVPSARHLLDEVDEVRFGRGPREAARATIAGRRVLTLRVPDPRMSTDHGRLVRSGERWTLEDPASKNGAVVDGAVVRRALLADGAVVELGRTCFGFRIAPIEAGAADDALESELRAPAPALATFDGALAEQFAALARVAPGGVSVLLHGETGTGKEVVARALHALSQRPGDLVAVNCGALPPSLVEAELFGYRRGAFTGAVAERLGFVRSADRGTLFLDEVGELPPASQAALLRVLQEREVLPLGADRPAKVDLRVCSATLVDLDALMAAGDFRRDLYARLFGFSLVLPTLRARIVDLGMLARRLLAQIPGGDAVRLTAAALRTLVQHAWPLNIRELEKTLATAVAIAPAGLVDVPHLSLAARAPAPAAPASPADLRERLVELLTLHRGNVIAVGKAMGTRRTQVYRWMQRFGLAPDAFRTER